LCAGDQKQVLQIITWVLLAATILLLLFTLLMIRRIKIAVATIKVAANAIGSMPTLLLFPILTFLTFVALFVYWVIVFAYLWSAGEMVQTYRAVDDPPPEEFTINTLFNSTAAGTSVDASSSITVGDPLSNVTSAETTTPCYDDPDCYYSVEFNERQQVCARACRVFSSGILFCRTSIHTRCIQNICN
jgi:choline transporter-like protein 2/4/5